MHYLVRILLVTSVTRRSAQICVESPPRLLHHQPRLCQQVWCRPFIVTVTKLSPAIGRQDFVPCPCDLCQIETAVPRSAKVPFRDPHVQRLLEGDGCLV